MKRFFYVLFQLFFFSALSFTFVSCRQPELDQKSSSSASAPAGSAAKIEDKVLASDLHPCEVTGTQLTDEDCKAAKDSLSQVKQGTAAIGVPTWMWQGETKIVTLALSNMPPPDVSPSMQSTPEPSPSQAPSNPAPTPAATPVIRPQPRPPIETPNDKVSKTEGSKKRKVIDYSPFVGKRMSAELTGDGFDIQPLFDKSDQPLVDNAITTWDWKITAKDFGTKTLIVKTNVVMINSRGKPEPLTPTTEYKQVVVRIGFAAIFNGIKNVPDWLKVMTAILMGVAALVGAWKALKALFDSKRNGG
jgi:hypothetical protein